MFNYRTCAMIGISMAIAAPALVFADFQNFSLLDDSYSRTELASVPASERDAGHEAGVMVAQHWQRDASPSKASDFPVRGINQFARR